jgi:hypothetical protein
LIMLWFVVTPQCIAATNLSAWQGMKRSKALVKGNIGRVIGLTAFLIVMAIGVCLIAWPLDLLLLALWRSMFPESAVIVSFRPSIIGILFLPLAAAVHSLLYYDLRARSDSP